jgi:hypothetical protein
MSAPNMPPKPPVFYRRMSTHGEMPVSIHNNAARNFNIFYKQPVGLGAIEETEENCNKTVAEVMQSSKIQAH